MPGRVIGSLGCIATHNGYQIAISDLFKCWSAFKFGYITATNYTPVYRCHKIPNVLFEKPSLRGTKQSLTLQSGSAYRGLLRSPQGRIVFRYSLATYANIVSICASSSAL